MSSKIWAIQSKKDLQVLENKVAFIVQAAAGTLVSAWQAKQGVNLKANKEPVTIYDVAIENNLRSQLSDVLPQAGFIVEEGNDDRQETLNWIIDPIDQTKNFIGHLPLFYVQVALLDNGAPVLGVIYNPVSRQLFTASRENGAKLNGQQINAQPKQLLEDAIIDVDFGGSQRDNIHWKQLVLQAVAYSSYRLRITGAAFAPYLLTGGIDALLVINERTKIVDQMPRIVLAKEAGLSVLQTQVGGHTILILGDKHVCHELEIIVRQSIAEA
jgi:myo-inositol-1(or 4)-monophosphatase